MLSRRSLECGELMRAAEVGRFSWDYGSSNPRHRRWTDPAVVMMTTRLRLFESQGLALEDIAACERIVQSWHEKMALGRH